MKQIAFVACLVASVYLSAQQTASQTGSSAGSGFAVIDHVGRKLGNVIGVSQLGNVATVAFLFHGKPLPILVTRSSFQQNTLFFVSSDCTGQPFQDASSTPFPMTTVSGLNNTLFVENGPGQAITAQSGLDAVNGCFQTSFPFTDAVPMKRVIDLNVFTPPFSVVSATP